MNYITNGTTLGESHRGQIAHSINGIQWNFLSKNKIKEISSVNDKIIRLHFDDNTTVSIDITKVINQLEWNSGDDGSITKAIDDISTWLFEDMQANVAKILEDVKQFQNGSKGWNAILPSHGAVNGNWYLIKALDYTTFSILNEKGQNKIAVENISSFIFSPTITLTTSDIEGEGFTTIQVTAGRVIAYKL